MTHPGRGANWNLIKSLAYTTKSFTVYTCFVTCSLESNGCMLYGPVNGNSWVHFDVGFLAPPAWSNDTISFLINDAVFKLVVVPFGWGLSRNNTIIAWYGSAYALPLGDAGQDPYKTVLKGGPYTAQCSISFGGPAAADDTSAVVSTMSVSGS